MANHWQLFDQVELVASVFSELYLPTLQANLEYMSETLHLEVEAFRKVKPSLLLLLVPCDFFKN